MPGKPWNRNDEKRLRALAKADNSIQTLAQILNQTSDAIRMKLKRLGVVVHQKIQRTTTRGQIPIGENLLTHEEALKELVDAIESLRHPGQDKLELQRLRTLVDALQAYDSVSDRNSIPNLHRISTSAMANSSQNGYAATVPSTVPKP